MYDELAALWDEAPLVHERHYTSESDSAYFDMRPQDGTNVCHRFRIRTPSLQGREEVGVVTDLTDPDEPLADAFDDAEVIVDEVFHTPAAAHVPDGAARGQRPVGRRAARGGHRHPDAVQHAPGPGRHLRDRRGGRPDRRPSDGGRLRCQDLHPHRGAHRRRREADRPPGPLRARPRRGLQRGHPAPGHGPGPTRREARRNVRRQAHLGLRQHRRLRRLRTRGRPEDGVRRSRPLPVRPRRRRLLLHLHQPAAGRSVPRVRRHAVRLGLRTSGRHDGRPAGHRCRRAAPAEPPPRGRHVLHGRGHARRPLRGAPRRRRGRRGMEARRRPLGQGRRDHAQGNADPEQGRGPHRAAPRRALRGPGGDRGHGPGRQRDADPPRRGEPQVRDGPDRGLRPRHRPGALRHPHHLEPLHPHDEPRAGGGRP